MHDISYRPPTVADLPRVNRLYRREYGDAYPYQLRDADLSHGVAFVALAGEEVVGCARAIRPNPDAPVFLFGGMIVDPPHRRHHIAKALTDLRFDAVVRAGARVVATEPVCCQPTCASQRNMIAHGFTPLGILPAKYPDIKPEILEDQPESLTLAIRWLEGEVSFEGRALFVGDELREVLRDTSRALFESADGSAFLSAEPMPAPTFHDPMRGTRADGSAFVDVPANWPDTIGAIAAVEREGYVACGFLPGLGLTPAGKRFDLVRLVRPRGRLRFEHVHVTEHLLPFKAYLEARCGE